MKTITLRAGLFGILCATILLAGCGASDSAPSNPGSGNPTTSQSGSTAAMLVHKEALYVLDTNKFKVFDIASNETSQLLTSHHINGAETLFIYDHYLYVGGRFGVDIWDITNPLEPSQVNFYQHVRGCDPIVVSDDIGYITLRNRPGCGGDINRLEVVDFSDPENPVMLADYAMASPYGLAKTKEHLAICQEEFGLTLLDVDITEGPEETTVQVDEVSKYNDINCFDLIYNDDILVFTATDGIYQVEVDGYWLTHLSRIPVGE